MSKKHVEPVDETPDEEQPVGYENVEPEAVEDITEDIPGDHQAPPFKDIITKPGGAAVSLDTDDRQYRVSFTLPYGVLVALIDWHHTDADTERAYQLGLLEQNYEEHAADLTKLTELGKLVLDGFDQTAVRHKMLAAWREQHNREVDGK